MAELDRELLRRLAEWETGAVPVSTLYLDVDGRKHPRKQDYVVRAQELAHQLREQVRDADRDARRSVEQDAERMLEFLDGLDRGKTRGVAMFSASAAGQWEHVQLPQPMPDLARVGEHPYVLRLEALLEAYETFCTVIVDSERARIFVTRMGQITEETEILDEVPGRHEQGGWSQARYQRHIEQHVQGHLKHVAEVLLRLHKLGRFDHLILAGPDAVLPEFERQLHDYVTQRIVSRTTLPMHAGVDDVLERSLAVEEEVEIRREREVVERVRAEAAAGRQAVIGLAGVLDALNDGRVDTLVVPFGVAAEGVRCTQCGRLATDGTTCRTCGGATEPVADIVESAVAAALKQSSRIEALTLSAPAGDGEPLGALLRY